MTNRRIAKRSTTTVLLQGNWIDEQIPPRKKKKREGEREKERERERERESTKKKFLPYLKISSGLSGTQLY